MVECGDFSRVGFIVCKNGKPDFWCPPKETGDWAEDNRKGRDLASRFILHTSPSEISRVLPKVIEAMGNKGRYEGIEIGFLYEIGATVARAKMLPNFPAERAAA